MAKPDKYNITIDKGATYRLRVAMKDSANNNMLASALYAEAQVRMDPDDEEIVASFQCNINSSHDTIDLFMDENLTATLDFDDEPAYWDLRVTWPSEVRYIVRGLFKVNDTVTRN